MDEEDMVKRTAQELIDYVAPEHCRTTCVDGSYNNVTGCTRCDLQYVEAGGKVGVTLTSWYHELEEED